VRWSNKKHKIKKHKPTASSPAEFNRFTYADNNPLSGKDIDGNRPLYSGIRTKEFYESASKSLMPQYMALLETQSQIYNAEQSTLNQFIQESITTNPFEQPMDLYIDGIRIRPGSAGYSMLLDLAMRGRTDMLGAVTIATYGGLSTNSGVVYDMGALLDIAIENYQREIIELQTAASKAQSKEELEETVSRPYFDTGGDPPGGKKKKAQGGGGYTLVNPTGLGIRNDAGGQGYYGASRGNRKHYGIDFQSVDGQDIVSPVSGIAINSSFINGKGITIPTVVIIPFNVNIGFDKLELLYVGPIGGGWRTVKAGDVIGQSVNLQSLGYPPNVGAHVHLQMRLNGTWIDPTPYFPGLK
jgi:hypothetical protein